MNCKHSRTYARIVEVVRGDNQHLICRLSREQAIAEVQAGRYVPLGKGARINRLVPAAQILERAADKERGRERKIQRLDMPKPTTTSEDSDTNVKGVVAHLQLDLSEYAIFRAPRFGRETRDRV